MVEIFLAGGDVWLKRGDIGVAKEVLRNWDGLFPRESKAPVGIGKILTF